MSNIDISEVQISFIKPQNGLIGFASLVINHGIYLSSIGIYKKLNDANFRLTYPTKKVGESSINIFHPINQQTGACIENAVFQKLKEVMNKNDRYNCSDN